MLKVGITGGIGSGKSLVCQVFKTLGIPVFNADESARYLIENNKTLVEKIINLFGNSIYINGKLDNKTVSAIVFNQPKKLKKLNELVHPATIEFGRQWLLKQSAPYSIKEAALFFETGSNKELNIIIGVYAPKELRIHRTIKRSGLTKEQIESRMASQMNDDKKMKRCDYVIINDDVQAIIPQVLRINEMLIAKSKEI